MINFALFNSTQTQPQPTHPSFDKFLLFFLWVVTNAHAPIPFAILENGPFCLFEKKKKTKNKKKRFTRKKRGSFGTGKIFILFLLLPTTTTTINIEELFEEEKFRRGKENLKNPKKKEAKEFRIQCSLECKYFARIFRDLLADPGAAVTLLRFGNSETTNNAKTRRQECSY